MQRSSFCYPAGGLARLAYLDRFIGLDFRCPLPLKHRSAPLRPCHCEKRNAEAIQCAGLLRRFAPRNASAAGSLFHNSEH